jgi:hypothetical protein
VACSGVHDCKPLDPPAAAYHEAYHLIFDIRLYSRKFILSDLFAKFLRRVLTEKRRCLRRASVRMPPFPPRHRQLKIQKFRCRESAMHQISFIIHVDESLPVPLMRRCTVDESLPVPLKRR